MLRAFSFVVLWLALTAEVSGYIFQGLWETPLTTVGTVLFNGLPLIHIYPWDLMVIVTMAIGLSKHGVRASCVAPLRRATRVMFMFLAGSWLWGVMRSGSAYQSVFQLHGFVMQFAVAYMLMTTCRSVAHLRTLGKVVVSAALYRSFVIMVFWIRVARYLPTPLPSITDHADSALFGVGILILVINALERPSPSATLWAVLGAIPIGTAIELNNRRLAWLGIVVGLALVYALAPKTKRKRRVNVILLVLSPLLVAYVAFGWGHATGIFTPVGSISSMFGEHQDASSMMRDIENYNLLQTLRKNPFLGTGWGHEYVEEVRAFDIASIFPQYRYKPHNSLLGVVAFAGMIGFSGIWQIIPVVAFLHARVYRITLVPVARVAALAGLVVLVLGVLQMWGDLGFDSLLVNVLMGASLAVAGRLPALVDVWPPVASTT